MDCKVAAKCGIVDYRLKNLFVNYEIGEIRMNLLSYTSKEVIITIPNFESISFQRKQPWGTGSYIAYSECENLSDDLKKLEIQLNSGDTIEIIVRQTK